MNADKISKVFEKNFSRTLMALGLAFAFIAAVLVAFFVSFGMNEARGQAQSILKTYRNNLVSILILKEEQALDVAIERMNEASTVVKFRRDDGSALRHLEYREEISTSGQHHGSLVYSIAPMNGFNVGVLVASLLGLAISFAGVWVAFRRAQNELTHRVSEPLEDLSDSILQLRDGEGVGVPFSQSVEASAHEIRELQRAFQRYSAQLLESQAVLSAARQDQAIARMTQMLAHDVRKPFSMFKAVVETIERCESPEEMRLVTQEFIPEVNRAMSTITGLLQDVMEVSSQAEPHREPTRPTALLETALVDVFAYQKDMDVSLEYSLCHSSFVLVDVSKVMRVFSNVCGNAIHAMNGKGKLWFRTKDVIVNGEYFVEFVIGNTGSFIPEEVRARLFEAFYTKNKKGGTGLGLAIAQKVVSSHGGAIYCRSKQDREYPSGMVEFIFTLPTASQFREDVSSVQLPRTSGELASRLLSARRLQETSAHDDVVSDQVLADLKARVQRSGRRLKILMVDDESVYRSAVQSHVTRFEGLDELVDLSVAGGSEDGGVESIDGAILDVDLGPTSLDGFQVAKKLRESHPETFLCIHSNRTFADDYRHSLESGADAFLPKPMSAPHFLRFLAQCADRAGFEKVTTLHEKSSVTEVGDDAQKTSIQTAERRRRVAVVDDSSLIRMCWTTKLAGEGIDVFESPESFHARCCEDVRYTDSLAFVVTDYHFGNVSMETGETFALALNSLKPGLPVFLASDGEFEADVKKHFARVVSKLPPTKAEFARWMSPVESRRKAETSTL